MGSNPIGITLRVVHRLRILYATYMATLSFLKKSTVVFAIIVFSATILGYLDAHYLNTNVTSSHAAQVFAEYPQKSVKLGNDTYTLYISDTIPRRTQGLSDIIAMDKLEGMAFVFDEPSHYGFWMNRMNFSLDFVYVREGKIVEIIKDVSPDTFPNTITPKEPADIILELNSGQIDASDIQVGDIFKLQ